MNAVFYRRVTLQLMAMMLMIIRRV